MSLHYARRSYVKSDKQREALCWSSQRESSRILWLSWCLPSGGTWVRNLRTLNGRRKYRMSTLRSKRLELKLRKRLTQYRLSTKQTLRGWRAALIGLLLICVATISGCASKSNLPVSPQDQTVDASLMVPSNYTKQLLEVLSQ
ncbi:Rz1-like protein [Klebsiella phage Kund-ULIP47]|uniref:Rz1-like protein n=1 Tax=Klebsiella phage Kund-ULIP47 TaxID=2307016 RepID=A0A4P6DC99_9CAUD|nr:Rz1-like protein [Klebsiella phage Kund-ULIP47]